MDSDKKPLRSRLDTKYADILRAIHKSGGSANTTEIKALTGIETNQIITQRMDRLSEWGLVEIGYNQSKQAGNRLPTKVATLTGYGRSVVDDGILDGLSNPDKILSIRQLNDRVDRHERMISTLFDRVDELE